MLSRALPPLVRDRCALDEWTNRSIGWLRRKHFARDHLEAQGMVNDVLVAYWLIWDAWLDAKRELVEHAGSELPATAFLHAIANHSRLIEVFELTGTEQLSATIRYLNTICRNQCIDILRKRKTKAAAIVASETVDLSQVADSSHDVRINDSDEWSHLLQMATTYVRCEYVWVLWQRYVLEQTLEELSTRTGVPRPTLHHLSERVMRRFRAVMEMLRNDKKPGPMNIRTKPETLLKLREAMEADRFEVSKL